MCKTTIPLSLIALLAMTPSRGLATDFQKDKALSLFQATATDGKVRAEHFDKPTNPPLEANHTLVEDQESALPPHEPREYASFIRDLVCQSEVIVTGAAISKQSFVTSTASTIFTDYSFAAARFVKGQPIHKLPASDTTLLISLRGGSIQTPNGPISVKNEEPLAIGEEYLLFLRRIPNTASFELAGPQFIVSAPAPRLRTRHELPTVLAAGSKTTAAFLTDIRTAASRCAEGGGK